MAAKYSNQWQRRDWGGNNCALSGLVVLVLSILCWGTLASAANVQGPKRGALQKLSEGDAVRNRVLLREGRYSVAPSMGFTLNDAFRRNVLLGLQGDYHLSGKLALGLSAFYSVPYDSALTERISIQRADASAQGTFTDLNLLLSADMVYTPVFGKAAIFGRAVCNYDLHVLVGLGVAGSAGSTEVEGVSPMGVLGVGMRFFIMEKMALIFQIRDHIFSSTLNAVVNAQLDDESKPTTDSRLQNRFALMISYGFFFPQVPGVSD